MRNNETKEKIKILENALLDITDNLVEDLQYCLEVTEERLIEIENLIESIKKK